MTDLWISLAGHALTAGCWYAVGRIHGRRKGAAEAADSMRRATAVIGSLLAAKGADAEAYGTGVWIHEALSRVPAGQSMFVEFERKENAEDHRNIHAKVLYAGFPDKGTEG